MAHTPMGQKAHSSKMPTSHLRSRTGSGQDGDIHMIWHIFHRRHRFCKCDAVKTHKPLWCNQYSD